MIDWAVFAEAMCVQLSVANARIAELEAQIADNAVITDAANDDLTSAYMAGASIRHEDKQKIRAAGFAEGVEAAVEQVEAHDFTWEAVCMAKNEGGQCSTPCCDCIEGAEMSRMPQLADALRALTPGGYAALPVDGIEDTLARAICREDCAFRGEPPCFEVGAWPNEECSEPGCQALAAAALAALKGGA